jgi:beta-lactamase superfamily II metal-dependent hydrolase
MDLSSLLTGALSRSSVKEEPKTQPFNNTSMILGVEFAGTRLLFTADAGSDAFDRIPLDWRNLAWMQVPHHGSDGNLSQKNIERFCPRFAFISACGDSSHPSRAIVNGLIKAGSQVCSTHSQKPGHLWYYNGTVPARADYGEAERLKATGDQKPIDWAALLLGDSR